MKNLQKILKTLSILMIVGLMFISASVAFASNVDRPLTDRENAAFIVRDEWTAWVKGFTASLSELDKNATSRIYSNMDFYDMQYRFTEKYKKVPEYLDEDGKPTQKLKDLIKEKRKEINGATTKKDFLCFTSNANGSTVRYTKTGSPSVDIGYSTDGTTFTTWAANTPITLNSGESIYVWNKSNTLSNGTSNYIQFAMSGSIAASGSVDSMINFSNITESCYRRLFKDCTVLTKAPEVPSTTLATDCYDEMFQGCTGLIDGPSVLPATNVPENAYYVMFHSCSNLKNAPVIKSKSLGRYSCAMMFNGCSSLEKAPELPATTLGESCYLSMFYNCVALIDAPSELPAITLAPSCYNAMFVGCNQMQVAPHIKATTLASGALSGMFSGCSNLQEISIDYVGSFTDSVFSQWVQNVAESGIIHYGGTYTNTDFGSSKLPKDYSHRWIVVKDNQTFLTFTSEQDGSSVGWEVEMGGSVSTSNLYYSKNRGSWTQWSSGSTGIALNKGETLRVWNKQNTLSSHPSTPVFNIFRFVIPETSRIAASGNVDSMLNFSQSISEEFALYELFKDCKGLTTAPKLGFTTISGRCYYGMFDGCTNLKTVPELPATTLAFACYYGMFKGCVNITSAPNLPATTLAEACYGEMFNGCTRLNNISIAYTGAFSGYGVPSDAFTNWVNGVSSTGDFYYSGSDTTVSASAIPSGWTVH